MEKEKPTEPANNIVDLSKIREEKEREYLKNNPEMIIEDLKQITECLKNTLPNEEQRVKKFEDVLGGCGFNPTEITNIILLIGSGRENELPIFLNDNPEATIKLHNNLEEIIKIISAEEQTCATGTHNKSPNDADAKIIDMNKGREGEIYKRQFRNEFEEKLSSKKDLRRKIKEMIGRGRKREVDERLLRNDFEETFEEKLSDQNEEDIQEKLKSAYRSNNEKEKKILLDILRTTFCLSEERINEICAFLEKPKKK